jgi:hypothetical protein
VSATAAGVFASRKKASWHPEIADSIVIKGATSYGQMGQLRLFYAFQLVLTCMCVLAIQLLHDWKIPLLVHMCVAIFWMCNVIVRYPSVLYDIDPYVVLSFFPWMHFPLLVLCMRGGDVEYSHDLLARTSTIVLIGFAALSAGMLSRPRCRESGIQVFFSRNTILVSGCICLTLSAPKNIASNSFYHLMQIPELFGYFSLLGVPAVGFLLVSVLMKRTYGAVSLLLIATSFALLATSRRALVSVAAIYVFAGLFRLFVRYRGRIPGGTVVLMLIGCVLIFFGAVARRAQTRAHSATDGFLGDCVENVSTLRDLGTAPNFLHAVELYPDVVPFERGSTVIALAVNPIPRALWKTKPLSMSVTMAFRKAGRFGDMEFSTEAWAEIMRASYSITFLGEMWANFGWAGVVCGPLCLAWIYRYLESWVRLPILGPLWAFYMAGLVSAIVIQNRGDLVAANNYAMAILLFGSVILLASKMCLRRWRLG